MRRSPEGMLSLNASLRLRTVWDQPSTNPVVKPATQGMAGAHQPQISPGSVSMGTWCRNWGGPQLQDKGMPGTPPERLPAGAETSVRMGPPVFGMGLVEGSRLKHSLHWRTRTIRTVTGFPAGLTGCSLRILSLNLSWVLGRGWS